MHSWHRRFSRSRQLGVLVPVFWLGGHTKVYGWVSSIISSSHKTMQPPCRAQLACHTSGKSDPARLRETWDNILAAQLLISNDSACQFYPPASEGSRESANLIIRLYELPLMGFEETKVLTCPDQAWVNLAQKNCKSVNTNSHVGNHTTYFHMGNRRIW